MDILSALQLVIKQGAEGGTVVVAVVMGLTAWCKTGLGLAGKVLTLVAMGLGLVLGMGYQLSALGVPHDFAGWFWVVLFGLVIGLTATGVYKAGDGLVAKSVTANYKASTRPVDPKK